MFKRIYLVLILMSVLFFAQGMAKNIGLCITATGRYLEYAQQCIASARTYFCPQHTVTFFLFTDGFPAPAKDVVVISQPHLGWPCATLKRFHAYAAQEKIFRSMDYVFALDADMLFVDTVGDEILGALVGTRHPGFLHKRGTYETRAFSTAYVLPSEGRYYFAGGFYGGNNQEFLRLVKTLAMNVDKDLQRDVIAVWHDESHLNRYFINNPPSIILDSSYCFPEDWYQPWYGGSLNALRGKIIALVKKHEVLQRND